MYNSDSEKDGFWDIDKLVPKRGARMGSFATDSFVKPYDIEGAEELPTQSHTSEKTRLTVPVFSEGESRVYEPTNMGLIKRVRIIKVADKYDFYDSFRKSALLYFDIEGKKCDFAQFYSYMPQYAQLSATQKNYYFYWRSQVRLGNFLKTDYSYLYLLVYEILNLPDKIPGEEGIKLLCRLWREYRTALPRIDLYFSIWIEDYCFVHQLPCPINELSSFLFECIARAPIREFYLADINEVGMGGIDSLLAYLSDYDWKRGKFVGAPTELSPITTGSVSYKQHMHRAMYLVLSGVWKNGGLFRGAKTVTVARAAFPNSLCTHSVKCRLEIEYISLKDSELLRCGITAAVRYTENKLRALLGIKSRLAIRDLPPEYKDIIDRYFDSFVREQAQKRREMNKPLYERLYEAPAGEMTSAGAEEIERMSWQTTARLVVDEYEEDRDEESTPQNESFDAGEASLNECGEVALGLGEIEISFLCDVLDKGFVGLIYSGSPVESVVEKINEAFLESLGDIVLESDGDGYALIEDYREDVREWLYNQKR